MLLYALERLGITLGIGIGVIVALIIVAKLVQVVRVLCAWIADRLWALRFLRDIRRCI